MPHLDVNHKRLQILHSRRTYIMLNGLRTCLLVIIFDKHPIAFWRHWYDAFGISWCLDSPYTHEYQIRVGFISIVIDFFTTPKRLR